jgi:hypothetical protein
MKPSTGRGFKRSGPGHHRCPLSSVTHRAVRSRPRRHPWPIEIPSNGNASVNSARPSSKGSAAGLSGTGIELPQGDDRLLNADGVDDADPPADTRASSDEVFTAIDRLDRRRASFPPSGSSEVRAGCPRTPKVIAATATISNLTGSLKCFISAFPRCAFRLSRARYLPLVLCRSPPQRPLKTPPVLGA